MLWRHRPTLVGALVLAAATAQAQPDPETIIRGGDVFVEGGVRAADVRIVGAVITEAAPASVRAPAGARGWDRWARKNIAAMPASRVRRGCVCLKCWHPATIRSL